MILQVNTEQMNKATQSLLEYGLLGAMFLLVVGALIFMYFDRRKLTAMQLSDKDREIGRLQQENKNIRETYRDNIEEIMRECQQAINRGGFAVEENSKLLSEIRHLLIKLLDSKL